MRWWRIGRDVAGLHGPVQSDRQVLLREKLPAGERKLAGELKFEECNDQICQLPQTVRFEIPLMIQPIKE